MQSPVLTRARERTTLVDRVVAASDEVEGLLRGVEGFVSYTLFRTEDGGVTVTVCQDKAGTDESLRVARDWIAANASDTGVGAPTVAEGAGGDAPRLAAWSFGQGHDTAAAEEGAQSVRLVGCPRTTSGNRGPSASENAGSIARRGARPTATVLANASAPSGRSVADPPCTRTSRRADRAGARVPELP